MREQHETGGLNRNNFYTLLVRALTKYPGNPTLIALANDSERLAKRPAIREGGDIPLSQVEYLRRMCSALGVI